MKDGMMFVWIVKLKERIKVNNFFIIVFATLTAVIILSLYMVMNL